MDRRDFVKLSAFGAAAAVLPEESIIRPPEGGQLKKAVLISMFPKEMSYLDRFKLAA
ncbi:MAG: twin-arginine translocation signal domain-containing protein, partial [Blastocatellia bacterium]|nr:twin-arginine translocation signal domain-containing protein [Blastocatellia bacterium]